MNGPGLRPVVKRTALLISLLYPALIWLSWDVIHPGVLGLAALMALAGRWALRRDDLALALLPLPLILAYALWLMLSDEPRVSLLYPVLVNLMLLATFAWTLWHPPSMAERLAQAAGIAISAPGVAYTRWVTAGWCVYFLANAAVTAWLAWRAPLPVWAVYTGIVSYLLVGLLLGVELLVRRWYRARVALLARR